MIKVLVQNPKRHAKCRTRHRRVSIHAMYYTDTWRCVLKDPFTVLHFDFMSNQKEQL